MYADDTVIYTSSKNLAELEQKLSADFTQVGNWMEQSIKAGKTENLTFGTAHKVKNNWFQYLA